MSSAGGVPPCRPLDVRPDPRWPSEWVTVACVTPWPYLAIQYQARGTHAAAAVAAAAAARGGSVVGKGARRVSLQTSLETTNHEMHLSAPRASLHARPASPATPGWLPACCVPCPRALLQDLPQVAPGPDILTALAGVATHSLAVYGLIDCWGGAHTHACGCLCAVCVDQQSSNNV